MRFIKYLFLNFVASGLALFFTDYYVDAITIVSSDNIEYIKIVAVAIVVLGIINTFIKPLLSIISFPFLIITFGMFAVIINAVVFFLLTVLIPAIQVNEFWGYFLIPIILGIFNWLTHLFVPSKKDK